MFEQSKNLNYIHQFYRFINKIWIGSKLDRKGIHLSNILIVLKLCF